jgi:signal peptidase
LRAASWTLLALAGAALVLGTVLWIQGWRLFAVQTGSMEPNIPVGALVVTAPVGQRLPAPGSVITFRTSDSPVTHRVQTVSTNGVITKGDANPAADPWTLQPRHLLGYVTHTIPGAGYVLVFVQQPTAIPSLLLLAGAVGFSWSLFFPTVATEPVRQARHSRGTAPGLASPGIRPPGT